jgi:hypothetical protein
MDISYFVNPVVSSGVVAAVFTVLLVWLLWSRREQLFTRTAFFWLVNIVFMAISAYHAAPFFGSVVSTIPGLEWAEQYIGLPVALVIDGITIVFMQARMEASYKRDDRKRDMYTRYVACAAGLNTVANLYTSIEHFQSNSYTHLWPLMQGLAPVVLSVFPMFLVAISKAADEMVNIKPLDKLNVEEFKAQEQKRVDILDAQANFLDKEAVIMQRLIRIEAMQKRNEILRRGIAEKSLRWPWQKPSEASVYEIVASTQDACIADLEQQIADIKSDILTAQSIPLVPAEFGTQMDLTAIEYLDNDCPENELEDERDTNPIDITQFHPRKSSNGQKASIKVSSRRKSMSVAEAATFLECSDRQVRRLRENGTLVTGEDDRLTSASVKAYKKKRSMRIGPEGA